jgi:hypothetical protein
VLNKVYHRGFRCIREEGDYGEEGYEEAEYEGLEYTKQDTLKKRLYSDTLALLPTRSMLLRVRARDNIRGIFLKPVRNYKGAQDLPRRIE